MSNQNHLKVHLGADKYDELLATAKASQTTFGRPLRDMSCEELMVALVDLQDQYRKAIRSARQMGRYEGTAVERGLRGEPASMY